MERANRGLRARGAATRAAAPPPARAGQGFGAPKPAAGANQGGAPQNLDAGGGDAVGRAVRLAGGAAPVDATAAARGRVDFVKVADWGSGRMEDLGELRVAGGGAAAPTLRADAPLHEQAARRLQAAEASGALAVARPAGAPPLPPFERWAFAEAHYAQHLADLLAAHAALEAALARGAAAAGGRAPALAAALRALGPAGGLARGAAIAADLEALTPPGGAPPAAAPNAAALARSLAALAERAERGAAAGDAGELSAAGAALLAAAYALLLALLSSGMRFGAAATERLRLFERGAVATYSEFPPDVPQPLEALVAAVNAAGAALSEAEREAFLAEAPAAMRRASLLLEALARES
jgi:hypothetical protein